MLSTLLFSQVSLIKQRPGSKIIMKTKWPLKPSRQPKKWGVRAEEPHALSCQRLSDANPQDGRFCSALGQLWTLLRALNGHFGRH